MEKTKKLPWYYILCITQEREAWDNIKWKQVSDHFCLALISLFIVHYGLESKACTAVYTAATWFAPVRRRLWPAPGWSGPAGSSRTAWSSWCPSTTALRCWPVCMCRTQQKKTPQTEFQMSVRSTSLCVLLLYTSNAKKLRTKISYQTPTLSLLEQQTQHSSYIIFSHRNPVSRAYSSQ